jgi:nicotinamidase-related amidase
MSTANVLVIVDVQNCFIQGGSFGGDSKGAALMREIGALCATQKFDYFVITRDTHPAHHDSHMITTGKGMVLMQKVEKNAKGKMINVDEPVSLPEVPAFLGTLHHLNIPGIKKTRPAGRGGPWPPHCRATPDEVKHIGKCPVREGELNAWELTEHNVAGRSERFAKSANGKPIIGTKISHMYASIQDANPAVPFFGNPDMKLSLLDDAGQQLKQPNETQFQFKCVRPIAELDRAPVLEVLKGQLCGWDAYSAFQYHADFSVGPLINDIPGSLDHTTGLAEVLFSNEFGINAVKPGASKVNIVVCGLVGEVCVKYSVSYGLNLMLLAKNGGGLKGYGRIVGERMTPAEIPAVHFVYSSVGTRFIPNPVVIGGVIPGVSIRDEIKNRVTEGGGAPKGNAGGKTNVGSGISYTLLLDEKQIDMGEDLAVAGTPAGFTVADVVGALGSGANNGAANNGAARNGAANNGSARNGAANNGAGSSGGARKSKKNKRKSVRKTRSRSFW